MERLGGEHEGNTSSVKQVALASLVGTTIEWYDYFIYGTTAALVFNQLFFPAFSPLAGTLAAFATFAVGFFARPLGGVIFGHYGDKLGRKTMLVVTLLLMGVATFLIGLLPSFETIGIWAPILLVVLRIVQGLGLGGEWGGAALMVSEHSPPNRRGFYASSVQMGAAGGLIISAAVITAVSQLMTEAQFAAWGWRIPFLASIVLIAVGTFIRFQIAESEAFTRLKEAGAEAQMPIVEVFRTRPKNVLLAAGTSGANNVVFYTVSVFTVSYGVSQLGQSQGTMLTYQLLVALVYFFTIPLFGALSDRIGRRAMIIAGIITMALFSFPYFWLVDTGSGPVILLAMVLALSVFQAAAYAPQSAFIPELFDTRVRYSGAALGYNLATMIFGGTAPFIATALFAWAGQSTWAISIYVVAICLVSFVSVYLATETPMLREGSDQTDERRLTASRSEETAGS
ncbi:MFS transporter [Rubrobacter marinus]|uniref:Putative proline/betaine transporter n=1 Tax=Rubrobacter marinus TaxID=2653852 RepID=A0A6G8PWE4_9ACTN|nr:MFS transporter [Rubrobacter marinus]QIN78506.1 MFS transporter [Rubrobacter marinus]